VKQTKQILSNNNEIDLADLVITLWREKILILSISIICGLLGYFYALSKPQEFKTEITLKNPPIQIFEPYNLFNNNDTAQQFISNFKLNFLSLDNLQSFTEESREFDNFKEYLKLRNISSKHYFVNQIGEAKDNNIIIPNKYFINHSKELDGAIFLNKYVKFVKKKTTVEVKNTLKLTILNSISLHLQALEIAKKIQLENPIIKTPSQQQIVTEPEALFYKGTKVITENLKYLNTKMIKLENEQFDYNIILEKSITHAINPVSSSLYFALGLMLGSFLSFVIIFFKNKLK